MKRCPHISQQVCDLVSQTSNPGPCSGWHTSLRKHVGRATTSSNQRRSCVTRKSFDACGQVQANNLKCTPPQSTAFSRAAAYATGNHDPQVTRPLEATARSPSSKQIPRCLLPSIAEFRADYYEKQLPVVIEGALDTWPAMSAWSPTSLRARFGEREVPVELSRWNPTDQRWGDYRDLYREQIPGARMAGDAYFVPGVPMSVESFIDLFMAPSLLETPSPAASGGGAADESAIRGHLAQHQLLETIPEMAADIRIPRYVAVGRGVYQQNAWMGPAGTATPLHRDPYHNLFAQVWGSKTIRLYAPERSPELQPFTTSLFLRNTSQVDVEAPDVGKQWPAFVDVPFWECQLNAGDLLYIPLKWWHYIRAREASLSMSFWWT